MQGELSVYILSLKDGSFFKIMEDYIVDINDNQVVIVFKSQIIILTNISVPYCYISTKNAKKKQKKMKGAVMQKRFRYGISIMILILPNQWDLRLVVCSPNLSKPKQNI